MSDGDVKKEQLYRWRWRKYLPDRFGKVCRLLVTGTRNSVLVQFIDDGRKVVTCRYALRKI